MITLAAKPILEASHTRLKKDVEAFASRYGRKPKLSVILVGEDPASQVYVGQKGKTAQALGMEHETLLYPASATPAEIRAKVTQLNEDPAVDGILIQRPLPSAFREEELVYWIKPDKDVDAFHPENVGRMALGLPCLLPCTPAGIIRLLEFYKIDLTGKVACVVGRSSVVGKPMTQLLLQRDATLLHAHSKTRDLASITKQADVLVVAAGRAHLIGPDHVKKGAVIIDVGMNRNAEGKLVGDVAFAAVSEKAAAITPVPGGVGPMTILMLMENTLQAAQLHASGETP